MILAEHDCADVVGGDFVVAEVDVSVAVASWDDVRTITSTLPETSEGGQYGNAGWRVKDKSLAWERPLRRSDLEALGPDAPGGRAR